MTSSTSNIVMKEESAEMLMTPCSPTLSRDRKSDSSTAQQRAVSAEDGGTGPTKRKASPDTMPLRKRSRGSDTEPQHTPEEDLRVMVLKRKISEGGEEPSPEERTRKKKKRKEWRRFDIGDKDSGSSSLDTGTESSSDPIEDCSISVEDESQRSGKRKATTHEEEGSKRKRKRHLDLKESQQASRAEFEAKYKQENQLGQGGCGSVFAGYRQSDNLPVAIKYVPQDNVLCKQMDKKWGQLSAEVAVMLKLAAGTAGSVGTSAPVSLLDWYDLGQELILVLERPVPSVDLHKYTVDKGGSLQEEEAKIILNQLVDAAKKLEEQRIFHRDIKLENLLIETGLDVPRVRVIDFGLSCLVKKGACYRVFYGTPPHAPPECYDSGTYRAGPTTAWQMGVVLFELLHHDAHFDTTEFLEDKLIINYTLSKDCQDFLRTCLSKAPTERPTLEQLQLHLWLR